jgi:glucan phosphoethanolaminetransferase (alkaline phosphatase superfamily)
VEETGENQRLKIFVEYVTLLIVFMHIISSKLSQGHRDRMVVAFRTTCANSVLIAVPLLSLKKILKNIFIFISS